MFNHKPEHWSGAILLCLVLVLVVRVGRRLRPATTTVNLLNVPNVPNGPGTYVLRTSIVCARHCANESNDACIG